MHMPINNQHGREEDTDQGRDLSHGAAGGAALWWETIQH